MPHLSKHCSRVVVLALLLCAPGVVRADIVTFTTAQSRFDAGVNNQGWWSSGANASDSNTNYIVAQFGASEYRNFFTFDLATLTNTAARATLRIRREGSSGSNEPTETMEFFHVATAAATLNNNSGQNAGIFADLGSGTSYGSFNVAGSGTNTDILRFVLNKDALDDINAAGGYFSVGGTMTSVEDGDYLFGFSGSYAVELRVQTAPEPTSLLLVGTGAFAVALRRRRRRRHRQRAKSETTTVG